MATRTRRRRRRQFDDQEALERALQNNSQANYPTIIAGFEARGIPAADIKPRENVFTYHAWQAKGRQVMRGERGVRIATVLDVEKKDPTTGEPVKVRKPRSCYVFHVTQTKANGEPDPPNHEPLQGGPEPATQPAAPATTPNPPRQADGPQGSPAALRAKADAMQAAIDRKLDPAILKQNPTRRRLSIGGSMVTEGLQMVDQQRALRAIADAIEAGTLEPCLWHVKHRGDVEKLYFGWGETTDQQRDLVRAYATVDTTPAQRAAQQREQKIREAEADLVGQKLPGFFPTPERLAQRMAGLANIEEGMEVLEPSAGKGDLAEAIREHAPPCELLCIERCHPLAGILELKEFQVFRGDCLEAAGEVDRVVMNPPYENGQDADHVRHCFDLLRPGGRLVALVGRGLSFRQDRKCIEFRSWLTMPEVIVVHSEQLDDAFNQPGTFRRTGVAVTLLVLDKPL